MCLQATPHACAQVIGLLKDAFVKAGLDLVLFPYGAIPTGYEQGIIEVCYNVLQT